MKLVLTQSIAAAILLSLSSNTNVDANGFPARNAWSLGRNVHSIAGLMKKRRSPVGKKFSGPGLQLLDEVCDCFENDNHSPEAVYAKSESIVKQDSPKKSLSNSVQNMIRGCYFVCPGEAYASSAGTSQGETMLASLRTLKKRIEEIAPKKPELSPSLTGVSTSIEEDEGERLAEPSAAILSGITQPLIPTNVWNSLTGREFFFPSVLSGLVQTGIRTLSPQSSEYIDWKPADSKTKKLLELNDVQAIRDALEDEAVLVWIGKFKNEGHGSHLPLVKTTSILPLAPKDFAALLMNSEKVTSYNKMSLGRNDEVVFQEGIDTEADISAMMIDGEAKIVRNIAKPPLSKKLLEFVTVMYARRLKEEDNVCDGFMGGNHEDGYAVISRAVRGGKWGGNSDESEESERTRSEILLGMNLVRSVPGQPNKTEVTAVTHCNSPSVPKMLATSVGIKGAVDFVRDIRALYK